LTADVVTLINSPIGKPSRQLILPAFLLKKTIYGILPFDPEGKPQSSEKLPVVRCLGPMRIAQVGYNLLPVLGFRFMGKDTKGL